MSGKQRGRKNGAPPDEDSLSSDEESAEEGSEESSSSEEDEYADVVHNHVTCDMCSQSPIVGRRYQGMNDRNYDMCKSCFEDYEGEETVFEEHPTGRTVLFACCDACEEWPIAEKRYQGVNNENYDLCETCFDKYKTESHFEHHPSGDTVDVLQGDPDEDDEEEDASESSEVESANFVHNRVGCDGCKKLPIVGKRYQGLNNRNFDLCESCFEDYCNYSGGEETVFEAHPSGKKIFKCWCGLCGEGPLVGERYQGTRNRFFDLCKTCFKNYRSETHFEEYPSGETVRVKAAAQANGDNDGGEGEASDDNSYSDDEEDEEGSEDNSKDEYEGFVHKGRNCDECGDEIVGKRYQGMENRSCELCNTCFDNYNGQEKAFQEHPTGRTVFFACCDACEEWPIAEKRYQGVNNKNYDLCETCFNNYKTETHFKEHSSGDTIEVKVNIQGSDEEEEEDGSEKNSDTDDECDTCDTCCNSPTVGNILQKINNRNYDLCQSCLEDYNAGKPVFQERPKDKIIFNNYCDLCNEWPLVGKRYQAVNNKNYDLCEDCFQGYSTETHFEEYPSGEIIRVKADAPGDGDNDGEEEELSENNSSSYDDDEEEDLEGSSSDDEEYAGAVHYGINCDICGEGPVVGKRFQGRKNRNFDLCNSCFKNYSGNEVFFEEHPSGRTIINVRCNSCETIPMVERAYQGTKNEDYALCAICSTEYNGEETLFIEHPSGNAVFLKHTCGSCEISPIVGKRYQSMDNPDYSLCDSCASNYNGNDKCFLELPGDKMIHRCMCSSCCQSPIVGKRYQDKDDPKYDLCERCLENFEVDDIFRCFLEYPGGEVIHVYRHQCDSCCKSPIVGKRYQGVENSDFDLCEDCFKTYRGRERIFEEHPSGSTIYNYCCRSCQTAPIVGSLYQGTNSSNHLLCAKCFEDYSGDENIFVEHPSEKTVFFNSRCLSCEISPIRGNRYQDVSNRDYVLCERCIKTYGEKQAVFEENPSGKTVFLKYSCGSCEATPIVGDLYKGKTDKCSYLCATCIKNYKGEEAIFEEYSSGKSVFLNHACVSCEMSPIVGNRYQGASNRDCSLCESCLKTYEGEVTIFEEYPSGDTVFVNHICKLLRDIDKVNPNWDILHQCFESIDLGQLKKDLLKGRREGNSALHLACHSNVPTEYVEKILEIGGTELAKIKDTDRGYLPLHWACEEKGNLEVIGILLQAHPDGALEQGDDGSLPLHKAYEQGCESEVIEALSRASIDAFNRNNRTHLNIRCGRCGSSPIEGLRYQSWKNRKYNLCKNCISHANILYKEEVAFLIHPAGTLYHHLQNCSSCSKRFLLGKRYQGMDNRNYNLCERCFDRYSGTDWQNYNGCDWCFEVHPSGKKIKVDNALSRFHELDSRFEGGDMSKPRRAYCEGLNRAKIILGKEQDKNAPIPVGERGITLRQLHATLALAERMCKAGTMMSSVPGKPETALSLDQVTLYDINKNIILPYTERTKKSFVETLPSTAGTQPPRWFISHWWGEQFIRTMACLDQLLEDFAPFDSGCEHMWEKPPKPDTRGGGMTLDTPVWICAFANNQHDLSAITEDPADSGFAQAMKVANHRTISILDNEGIVFSRIWCIEELYLTHTLSDSDPNQSQKGIWGIYTHTKHKTNFGRKEAVGIVTGGTTKDEGYAPYTGMREKHFPGDLIFRSLDLQVQTAQASVESDRRHILNSITKIGLNEEPLKEHALYDWLNDVVRGGFAVTIPAIRAAHQKGRDAWLKSLPVIKKSSTAKEFMMDFTGVNGVENLGMTEAIELVQHLPKSLENLRTEGDPYGAPFMNAVIDFLETQCENIVTLHLDRNRVALAKASAMSMTGSPECGARLAAFVGRCKTINLLILSESGLVGSLNGFAWEEALKKNTSLTRIDIKGFTEYKSTKANENSKMTASQLKARLEAATTAKTRIEF